MPAPSITPRSRPDDRPLRRPSATAVVVALLVLLGLGVATGPASRPAAADPVADLQAQARQIAERLSELDQRSGALAEQFNQAQVRAAELTEQIAATRRDLDRSRAEREARRAEVARYAVSAYVDGGGATDLDLVVNGKAAELGRRQGYTTVAVGDRQDLVDRFRAAERAADDDLTTLTRSEADLAEQKAQILRKQQQADALAAEQERIQSRVQGELADAVAQQQALLAEQAEAAARARFGAPPDAPPVDASPPAGPASTAPSSGGPSTTVPPRPGTTAAPATTRPASPTTSPPTAPPTTRPAPPPPPPPPPPPSDGRLGTIAVNAALSQQGVPYSWGGGSSRGPTMGFGPGAGTVGYDCSGLTLYAWAQAGVPLARVAQSQYDTIRHVPMSALQPGDLIFYGGSSRSISHVAIYIGGGQVVHAPHTGAVVRTASMYLGGSFGWVGAGRPAG